MDDATGLARVVVIALALQAGAGAALAQSAPDFVAEQEIITKHSALFAEANGNSSTSWMCADLPSYEEEKACYQSVLENEGQYSHVWRSLAELSERHGKLRDAAHAYAKWFELRARCAAGATVHCFGVDAEKVWSSADWWNLVDAGLVIARTGDYAAAAKTLRQAIESFDENPNDLVGDENRRRVGEWLAIVRYGATDAETAWAEYKELLSGPPLPDFNREGLGSRQARRLKAAPEEFYALLRSGMLRLSAWAREENQLFYEYLHAQNVARAEALRAMMTRDKNMPVPYESEEARDRLLAILLDIKRAFSSDRVDFPEDSIFTVQPSVSVHPALSQYAIDAAQSARAAAEKGKTQDAEDMLRLALATDPWWSEARYELARLEFINYGWCGPDETLLYIEELAELGIGATPPDGPFFAPFTLHRDVDYFQAELDEIWKEAGESGSRNLVGWCDIEGAVAIRPDVEVR